MKTPLSICLFLILAFPYISYARETDDPFYEKGAQKAVFHALDSINSYISPGLYVIEDFTSDLLDGWWGMYFDKNLHDELLMYRIDKKGNYDERLFSPFLYNLRSIQFRQAPHYKYVLDVSPPYKGVIGFELLPKDRKIGMAGEPQIHQFAIRYDVTSGKILEFHHSLVNID